MNLGTFHRVRILFAAFTLIGLAATCAYGAKLEVVGKDDLAIDGCRIRVSSDQPRMYFRGPDGDPFGSFEQLAAHLAKQDQALVCATNAGIYGKDLRPIGLYIEDRRVMRRLNTRHEGYGNFYLQPNGVFVISDQGAAIWTTDEFAADMDAKLSSSRYATQSGPVLIQRGAINPLFVENSENRFVRNAVCLMSQDEFVLARSQRPISFYAFAKQLRDGWKCTDALYLDGNISRLHPLDSSPFGVSFSGMIGVTRRLSASRP
jgi:uncharacterized protein YigE (DUF2233 family)